jgi:hypothetical protein
VRRDFDRIEFGDDSEFRGFFLFQLRVDSRLFLRPLIVFNQKEKKHEDIQAKSL